MSDQYRFPTNIPGEFFLKEGCYIIEILNQTNEPDLSISRARVEAGQQTEAHALLGTKEWYYILEGSGTMHIDQQVFPVSEGDVVAIPAQATQWIENTGDQDLIFLCICLPRWEVSNYRSTG